jgi:hypothetical protein
MKNVFTLAAEGFAEYAFIPIYLKRVATPYGFQMVRSKLDLLKKQSSKSKVLAQAQKLCLAAMQDEHHFLFIAGIDLDVPDHDPAQEIHGTEIQKLRNSLKFVLKKFGSKIILFVPVQAIESWLAYQHYKLDGSACPARNSLESPAQRDLKIKLYGSSDPGEDKMVKVASAIAENADFDELARQSRSFKHFHDQVISFLKTATES